MRSKCRILNIIASFVFLPALVICFGERRAAIIMMCCGLSGFVLMGFSGITALDSSPGDGSTSAAMSTGGSPDASLGRWVRVACMVMGFPLHNMVRSVRASRVLSFRLISSNVCPAMVLLVVQRRHNLHSHRNSGSSQEPDRVNSLALAVPQYVCAQYVATYRNPTHCLLHKPA